MRKRKKRGGTEWVQSWEREKGRENHNQKHCMGGKIYFQVESNTKIIMSYK